MELAGMLNWSPDRREQLRVLALAMLAVVLIGLAHYLTGPAYEFHIFFLLPVIAASWYIGPGAGLAVSLASVLHWLLVDWLLLTADGRPINLFNELARLSVLLVVSRLASGLRRMTDGLEQRVSERTAELARANEDLVHSNLELQRFNYIASHDLQTPLRSIVGFAQLLQKDYQGRLDTQADELIRQVVENTHRMHGLLRDMAVYSRLETRPHPFQAVDLGQVVQAALASLTPAVAESGAEVVWSGLPTVKGDRSQLTLLFQHLVGNAVKYRTEAPPCIHVQAEPKEGEWQVSVRDNGIGIAPRHHGRIFDVFYRLHTQGAYPGTGIGLALCRRIVERHGGRIWVESEAGQGSVFRFTLPAGDTAPPSVGEGGQGTTNTSASA